jgi:DNA-binding NarL/FixJ family response regulator
MRIDEAGEDLREGRRGLTVVIADDDPRVCSALAALLEDDDDLSVVARVGTAGDAVDAAHRVGPDILVLDVRMPGGGLNAAREIQRAGLPITIVGVSATLDAATVDELLGAGARGALVKGQIGANLPAWVKRCNEGEILVVSA